MHLHAVRREASFNPYEVLIEWGFSNVRPEPRLSLDVAKPIEISNALHEFTHQDGMYSEMGIRYLHVFWKFISEIESSRNPLAILLRPQIWEAYWLMSFLLEGQAMYAQLHLHPSPKLEATCPQFTFMQTLGIQCDRIPTTSLFHVANGVYDLFRQARLAAHKDGLKRTLLLDTDNTNCHYLLGYLFFRNVQCYLSRFEPLMADSEIFMIFFSNFLFNNVFHHFSTLNIFDLHTDILFCNILSAIEQLAPRASQFIEPIVSYPNYPINFAQVDYIASLHTPTLINKQPLETTSEQLIDDLLKTDKYFANILAQSIINLQLSYLKSVDAHIISLGSFGRSFLCLACHGEQTTSLCGLAIDEETAAKIKTLADKKGASLLLQAPLSLRLDDILPNIDKFVECEIHVIIGVNEGWTIIGLAVDEAFVPLRVPLYIMYPENWTGH
jgi:hypothetical protein